MGVNVCFCQKESENVIKESSVDCYKKIEQSYLENVIISNNINLNHKTNSTNENLEEKKQNKTKYKKIFNEMSAINTSKNDIKPVMNFPYIKSDNPSNQFLIDKKNLSYIIKIQSFYRNYLQRKHNKEKYENNENEIEKISLKLNYEVNDIALSSNSLRSPPKNQDYIKINSKNENGSDIIVPFNLKNKFKMNYRYSGYIKKVEIKKSISSKNLSDNSNIMEKKEKEKEFCDNEEKAGLIKEGFGKFIFMDGTEFCGIFHDNVLQNYGQYSNFNGKNYNFLNKNGKEIIITDNTNYGEFIGEYKNYISDGFGIYKNYITNLQLIGFFNSNGISGIGIEDSIEGGYVYQGEFINNKKEGYGNILWKDGNQYQGQFKNNQLNGYGIIEYPGQKYYQGEIKNGRMEGFGEFFWKNEKKYIGNYKNDKRNGFGVFIIKSNNIPNSTEEDEIANNYNLEQNKISAYIGFWKNGNMDGFGIKVYGHDVKYGIWENGNKKKYLESNIAFKTYFRWSDKKYNKLFLAPQTEIFKFLDNCININEQINPIKKENS